MTLKFIKDPEVLCTHKAVLMVDSGAIEDVLVMGRVGLVTLVHRQVSSLGNCV